MSIFNRLFKVGQSHAHNIVDKMEDPIKMTEQGIRDLKKDLQQAMTTLVEVKGLSIRTRKQADKHKKLAADYERKAMLLLQKMQKNEIDPPTAERLATEALNKKESHANDALKHLKEAEHHEKMAAGLQANVNKIKTTVNTFENDLVTLRARAKTAASTKKIDKQLAKIDSSGTIAMLEKMKARVEDDESLAIAYSEMAGADESIDDEINTVLISEPSATKKAELSLCIMQETGASRQGEKKGY